MGSAPVWGNQEYHNGTTGGNIDEYKLGPTSTTDPSVNGYGAWHIAANTAQYKYPSTAGGWQFTFTVSNNNNGTYSFCNGASEAALATIHATSGYKGPCL